MSQPLLRITLKRCLAPHALQDLPPPAQQWSLACQLLSNTQVVHPLYCEALATAAAALAAPPPAAPPRPLPYLFGSPEYLQVHRLLNHAYLVGIDPLDSVCGLFARCFNANTSKELCMFWRAGVRSGCLEASCCTCSRCLWQSLPCCSSGISLCCRRILCSVDC